LSDDGESIAPVSSSCESQSAGQAFKLLDVFLILGAVVVISLALQWTLPASWRLRQLVVHAGLIISVIFLCRRRRVDMTQLISAGNWRSETTIGVKFALLVALLHVVILVTYWFGYGIAGGLPPVPDRLLVLTLSVFVAPISEELFFRGVMQSALQNKIGRWTACVVQAVVFTSIHFESLHATIVIFVAGFLYGALYAWRQCLLPSMLAHMAWNTVIAASFLSLLVFNVHTPAVSLDDGRSDPEWLAKPPLIAIADRQSAEQQLTTALQFGSKGLQLWKAEIKAFEKLCQRFPDDDVYCARSLAGIQEVYLTHLSDPYRAIVVGQEIIDKYPEQRESCSWATIAMGRAYLELSELDEARTWLELARKDYSEKELQGSGIQALDAAIQNAEPDVQPSPSGVETN
jgi:membrane protease YdiL (CAAX protease family)